MAAYAATVTIKDRHTMSIGKGIGLLRGTVDLTNYNSTLAEISGITGRFRDTPIVILGGASDNGYIVAWSAADKAIKAWYPRAAASAPTFTGTAPTGSTVSVKDDDNAASTGVAVYLHVDEVLEQGIYMGHLEFVSPTNADGSGTVNNGGPGYVLQDDDAAATGGYQLYFDEDGTAGSRVLANITEGRSVFVMLSNGEMLKITHDASASSNGVAVYFDEDGTNSYERLLFVSPTDADGSDATSATVGMTRETAAGTVAATGAAAGSEVANDTDVGAVEFIAVGRH